MIISAPTSSGKTVILVRNAKVSISSIKAHVKSIYLFLIGTSYCSFANFFKLQSEFIEKS